MSKRLSNVLDYAKTKAEQFISRKKEIKNPATNVIVPKEKTAKNSNVNPYAEKTSMDEINLFAHKVQQYMLTRSSNAMQLDYAMFTISKRIQGHKSVQLDFMDEASVLKSTGAVLDIEENKYSYKIKIDVSKANLSSVIRWFTSYIEVLPMRIFPFIALNVYYKDTGIGNHVQISVPYRMDNNKLFTDIQLG